jgi:hypothetical protein
MLILVALEWQKQFGVAPQITSAISEYDAAMMLGCSEAEYSRQMQSRTAVSKGFDFAYDGFRYQVKANRPSGRRGSKVTLVAKPTNYEWDKLIWILYDREYLVEEAWLWDCNCFMEQFHEKKRLCPDDMRRGTRLETSSIRN